MKAFIKRIAVSIRLLALLLVLIGNSCGWEKASHNEMINLLKQAHGEYERFDNYYASAAQAKYFDSLIHSVSSEQDKMLYTYSWARALIALGKEEEAIGLLESLVA